MRPILITGARGTLGQAFARIAAGRGLATQQTTRRQLDVGDPRSIGSALELYRPWAVINTAGYVRVDEAESNPDRCRRENARGAALLARACASNGLPLVTFSTDLVFDGEKSTAYDEDDSPAPLNQYGRSELEAEQRVCEAHPAALVVRTSSFFGPWDPHNFVTRTLGELAAGRDCLASEIVVSPTYVPDLVHACLDLLIDGEAGLWHLTNGGETSWADLGRLVAVAGGHDPGRIGIADPTQLGWRALRPRRSALATRRGALLPSFDDALRRYLEERVPS